MTLYELTQQMKTDSEQLQFAIKELQTAVTNLESANLPAQARQLVSLVLEDN